MIGELPCFTIASISQEGLEIRQAGLSNGWAFHTIMS